ncbi:MAG: Na/Pi cotransporter family protein [Sphaerochaetaceae bacterium]|nr:Na/Pi cotransporter family protein [Sphaerochaetaceae bacterium]
MQTSASMIGIAIVHSIFNVCCTIILFPFASLLEKIVLILIPDDKKEDDVAELDTRLFSVPSLALGQCRNTMLKMVNCTLKAIEGALSIMNGYNEDLEKEIKDMEDKTDYYEDIISTYLVNLSTRDLSDTESNESASYLKLLADFERIGDHAVGLSSCSKEIMEKDLEFSLSAKKELKILYKALEEVVTLTCKAFEEQNSKVAEQVEPLARVIVDLKEQIRMHHVIRLQQGSCSISSGFVLSDILTNIERTADHCSNIAGTVMEIRGNSFSLHENLREYRLGNDIFRALYNDYAIKYALCHVQ